MAASSPCRLAPGGLLSGAVEFEEQFLVQLPQLALRGSRQLGEHPVITHGMITERLVEAVAHESGIPGI